MTTAFAVGLRPVVGFGAADILYPNGNARLSTIVAFSAFVALAVVRRSWLPVVACLMWLFGFELALDVTVLALGRPATLDALHFVGYLVTTVTGSAWLAHRRVRPAWTLLAGAVVVWIAWMATGFHVNAHTTVRLDPLAEAFNEGTKTLFALAILLPLLRIRLPLRRRARGDAGRAARAETT